MAVTGANTLMKLPHVAIVGAGFAGLRCADVLLRNGVKVTIFEARNRIGGRVHQCTVVPTGNTSSKANGHLVDMGPNWIHGTEGNPIMKLAERTGAFTIEPEERQLLFDPDGNMRSEEESQEISAAMWEVVVEAFKHSNANHEKIDPQMSLMDFFKQQVPKVVDASDAIKSADHKGNDKTRQKRIDDVLNEAAMWGFFVGGDIERQSLRCFFLEECLEGDNVIVASTYNSILREVARRAVQDAKVVFEEEVVKIEYRAESANGDADHERVVLSTKGKLVESFDEVVVTCPLGWLKRNTAAFVPSLPPRMTQAIDNIGYGCLEKLLVTFPSAWWLDSNAAVTSSDRASSSASSAAASPFNASSLSSTPPPTTTNISSPVPLFTQFHHPTFHPDPASKNPSSDGKWNQSIVSLSHLPGETAHPTLLFYIYGALGAHLTSQITHLTHDSPEYATILSTFAHPFISRLPGYKPTDSSCQPISYLVTDWQHDPHAGYGSYSNFQVGLEAGDADIEVMRDGGGVSSVGRGLWFAGEHTAPFVAVGTTTGAYWAGEGVAGRILGRYGVVDVGDDDDVDVDGNSGEGEREEVDRDIEQKEH